MVCFSYIHLLFGIVGSLCNAMKAFFITLHYTNVLAGIVGSDPGQEKSATNWLTS